jgi:asparagine synthase (glutamine-hydrolysing)
MYSADTRYVVVFNGEIYNYRELRQELKSFGHDFRTDSDTEVLLAAWAQWGIEALSRFKGMFAFALLDQQTSTLTLARDAFGIKPFFYYQHGTEFAFASEISALLDLLGSPRPLNLQRAYDYLVYGTYDNGTDTFYEGVYHLAPGHWFQLNLQTGATSQPVRWWWPSIAERRDINFRDAVAQVREMFLDNVRLHLRSDVPLGAALSGGIDSSAVVCAMRYLEPDMPIHTFSYVARGSSLDEERWADLINQHVGAIAHKVMPDNGQRQISLARLRELQQALPAEQILPEKA